MDIKTGSTLWTTQVDAVALGVPEVVDDAVTVLGVRMPVRCQFAVTSVDLQASSGNVVSMNPAHLAAFSSSDPITRRLVAEGTTFSWLDEDRITAVSARATTPRWQQVVPTNDPAGLAYGDGLLVVASVWEGLAGARGPSIMPLYVSAFDARTGQQQWVTTVTGRGPFAKYRLGEYDVMVGAAPSGASIEWNTPNYGQTSVAVMSSHVYVGRASDEIAVLDLATGHESGALRGAGRPVAAADGVVVGRHASSLVALDPNGQRLWSAKLPKGAQLVRVAAHGGKAYVAVSGRYGGRPCPLD